MNILLLGSGGREHALAWKISQSPRLSRLFIAPGNAGTERIGTNVTMTVDDFSGVADFVRRNKIDMVVVGPEDPLVKGIADYFASDPLLQKIPVIGPSRKAAMIEGSKGFAKDFMTRHNIPTARYFPVTIANIDEGFRFFESLQPPYVLKADGLAAGKGVLIIQNMQEAKDELRNMLGGKFGEAGRKVLIEEYLNGIELSVFIITDGKSYKLLPEAKDYKRVGVGDTGPNTGGMGSVSPVPFASNAFMQKVEQQIIIPTIRGLQSECIAYKGFIFFGLINCKGNPYVIEYNARLGDPESEVILPRLTSDIIPLLEGVAFGTLAAQSLSIDPRCAVTVMLTSGGYPGSYEKGKEVRGLEKVRESIVFHAGTKTENSRVLTNGGRVIAVTSLGTDMKEALAKSYKNAKVIDFDKKYYRGDIGFDLQ